MQKEHSHYKRTIPALLATLVLACLGLAPATQAAGHHSIVGMWSVHYVIPPAVRRSSLLINGTVMGWNSKPRIWLRAPCVRAHTNRRATGAIISTISAWTFDSTGAPSGYWDENLVATVSADGQSYSGTFARNFYDVNGNFLFENDGTLTATRLNVER